MAIDDQASGGAPEHLPGEGDIGRRTIRIGQVVLAVENIASIALTIKPRNVGPMIFVAVLIGAVAAAAVHSMNLDYALSGSVFLIVLGGGAAATGEVLYQPKPQRGRETAPVERFEPAEFLARLLQHVPEPRLHQLRYIGRYSNVARARRAQNASPTHTVHPAPEQEPDTAERRRARRAWAHLIRRVYEIDPLICRECGGEMHILAFILQPVAIAKILDHLTRRARLVPRGPPAAGAAQVRAAS